MNIDVNKVRIVVTVPTDYTQKVRNAMCDAGAGVIGNYSYCTISTKCRGTFIPSDIANPYIGEKNKIQFVEEEKIETVCDINVAKEVILKLREAHPYEEPAISIIPLIDENCL